MPRTLPVARDEFIAAMKRDTVKTERPRFVAVLDAMIAWSVARPTLVKFRTEESKSAAVTFERVGSKEVFWTAVPRKRDVPRLELLPRVARSLNPDERAKAMAALNEHSRMELIEDDPLRIGFGALKSTTARTAVLALMDQLLVVT